MKTTLVCGESNKSILGVELDRVHTGKHAVQTCGQGCTLGKWCITVQSAEFGTKLSTSKSPLRKATDVQDGHKSSDLVVTGPHIEDHWDRTVHNILDSKTLLYAQRAIDLVWEWGWGRCMQFALRMHWLCPKI